MIGILVSIAFAVWFYLTAKKIDKNPIVWAAIGLVSYYGPVFIYSMLLRGLLSNMKIRVSSSGGAIAYGLMIGLSAVAVGAISAYYIRKKFLLKEENSNTKFFSENDKLEESIHTKNLKENTDKSSTEDLEESLFKALDEAWLWGKANQHPGLDQYPQFNEVRRLGEKIAIKSGFNGMQAAIINVKERARPIEKERSGSEYLGGYTALAEKAWIGIDNWH